MALAMAALAVSAIFSSALTIADSLWLPFQYSKICFSASSSSGALCERYAAAVSFFVLTVTQCNRRQGAR